MDGYPHNLKFKDHDVGYNLIHIHCCRWITSIPSLVSDKFFRAVVKPITVKHMKVGYNSTGYKMVEQDSSWKVPYTNNV